MANLIPVFWVFYIELIKIIEENNRTMQKKGRRKGVKNALLWACSVKFVLRRHAQCSIQKFNAFY